MRADDFGALGFVGEEVVHLLDGAVEGHDGEAVVVHVQNEILAHDGQTNQCDVSLWFHLLYQLKQGPMPVFLQTPCFAKKQWHGRTDDTTARSVRQQYFMKNPPKIVYRNFRPPTTRAVDETRADVSSWNRSSRWESALISPMGRWSGLTSTAPRLLRQRMADFETFR